MVFQSRTFLGIILALALAGTARSQSPPPTMPVSEIRTGMKGYGLTVFKGGTIERFNFEVLGIEKNYSPGRNRILFKAAGGPLADTGIMAGMSGSPCYIDGKLIGALSIGFPWAKEPIGGITPIHEMLDQLMDVPDAISARTPLMPPRLDPSRIVRSAQFGEMVPLADILGFPKKTESGNAMTGQHLPIVLYGSSLSPEAKACWNGLPVQFSGTVASAGGAADPSPIEPGGMVAVTLVQGDMMLAATGTITYVSDKRILLFGHNLISREDGVGTLGAIDLPLWSASVITPLARYSDSMKLSQPVAQIGAIRLDRPTGVAGILNAEPKMIPFRIGLNLGGKKNLNFSFDVIDHPALTPFLVYTVLMQTIVAHVREAGMQSLSLQGNIKIANQQPLMVENMSADLSSSRLPEYFAKMLQDIYFNPFERPVIEGLSVNIKGEERFDRTDIVGVRPLVARAKRGQSLPLLITLQNIQGVRETATLSVQVPLSAKPGKAILKVGDGLSMIRDDSERIRTTSLSEMILLINGTLKNNYAYAFLTQEIEGTGLRGNRIEGIPPSISSLLMSDGDTSENRLQRRVIGRAVLPLEREVRGLFTLELEIE